MADVACVSGVWEMVRLNHISSGCAFSSKKKKSALIVFLQNTAKCFAITKRRKQMENVGLPLSLSPTQKQYSVESSRVTPGIPAMGFTTIFSSYKPSSF